VSASDDGRLDAGMPQVGELGRLLRDARVERGLELTDIAERTHVRLDYLRSLEEGNYEGLPEDVYTRNFVRLYAKAVGVGPDEAVEVYQRERQLAGGLSTMEVRLEREREAGMDSMVLPVLNVYDDLERALEAAAAAGEEGPFVTGVRAVRDSLLRQLDSLGIRVVGLRGEGFDPELHEALAVVAAGPDAADGTIVQVFSAGFAKGDRLIRPAKVIVAKEDA